MSRESPYPQLGPDGNVVQQPQQSYAPPPQGYGQQQAPYMESQNYGGQPQQQAPQQWQQQGGYAGPQQGQYGGGKWEGQYTQDYGNKTEKFDAIKPK